jgi:predicted DNA-binding antitoxin AbrB/MazE fold protein
VFASRRAREREWTIGRLEEGSRLKVKPRNQRNQEDIDEPLSRWLKRIKGGVCAISDKEEEESIPSCESDLDLPIFVN